MKVKVDCTFGPPPGLEHPSFQQPEATPEEYSVGDKVLVLRSNGSWSPGTIAIIRDDKVKVVLKEGSKIIRADMMHSLMKKAEPSQPQSLLDNQHVALETVMLSNASVHLANEKIMLENAMLRMQLQNCAEQQWWAPTDAWMPSQAVHTPASTTKATPPLKSKKQSKSKTPAKVEIVADGYLSSESTSAGSSSGDLTTFASSTVSEWSEPIEAAPLPRTTVMMRNIPNTLTREMLLDIINTEGFVGCYDFVYLPMDFKSMAALGYSFINFLDSEDAERFKIHFSGFSNWGHESDKVCEMTWSTAIQGQDANIERYRNSPVMHHSMPEECKPLVFKDGERVAFPKPSKQIRAPKPSILGLGRPEPESS